MTEMDGWIKLNPSRINKLRDREFNGIHIQVMVAPYDVPTAVRGSLDSPTKTFNIAFKYSGEEETESSDAQHDGIQLFIGKDSKRLYRIEIDLQSLKPESIGLTVFVQTVSSKIIQAINELANRQKLPVRSGNYDLAKDVIAENQDSLLGELEVCAS